MEHIFCMIASHLLFLHITQGTTGTHNRLDLHSCNSVIRLHTNRSLKELFTMGKRQRLSVNIALKRKISEKGCGQDTYNPLLAYNECGIEQVLPLLPTHNAVPVSFIKPLVQKISVKGGLHYIFDGGTAVRYPTKQLPMYWFHKYTISGWIQPHVHNDRQYIISWSDGDTPRHQNTGFYVSRRLGSDRITFGFHHQHDEVNSPQPCIIKEKWKLEVDDTMKWHYFTLSFNLCAVELTVDGKFLSALSVDFTYQLPGKHIQPKFVIGARWAGSVVKYSEYFHGSVSGLMLKYGHVLSMNSLNCLLKCKEKLQLSTQLPSGLQEEGLENGGQLIMEGQAEQTVFENLLNDIIYINNNEYPENDQRTVSILITNRQNKKILKQEIFIDIRRKTSSIVITGDCGKQEDSNLFFKQGMKLCPNLRLSSQGCSQMIDTLNISVLPELSKKEKLFVAAAYLKRHHMTLFPKDNGFVLYGESGVAEYMGVLHQVKYSHTGVVDGQISRTIIITASSRNGLIKSNSFIVTLKASEDWVDVSPNSKHQVKPSNNFINLIKVEQGEQQVYTQPKKKVAVPGNQITRNYVGWMALACGFSVMVILFMVGYGIRKRNRRVSLQTKYFLHEHHTLRNHNSLMDQPSLVSLPKSSECVSPDFYWDEEGLSMRLIINPSERISIINDPYSELMRKQQRRCEETATDGSVYSDEESSDFDTDSIRQLEWDFLENNLDEIIEEDKLIKEVKEGKRRKEELYNEVFL